MVINNSFPSFADSDGSPLNAGYVYFGAINLNPETNPISVYWDDALTIPATQPIRTLNGYIVRDGSPANLYAATDYSITVRNKNSILLYSLPDSTKFDVLSLLKDSSGSNNVGFIQAGTGAVARTVQSKLRDFVNVKDFGAVGDGTTDDTAAIQAAIDYAISQRFATLYFPPNNPGAAYKVTAPLVINNSIAIVGAGQRAVTINAVGFAAGQYVLDFNCAVLDVVYHARLEGLTIFSNNGVPNGVRLKNISYMLMKQVQLYALTHGVYITGTQTFSNFFEQVTGYTISGNTIKWETFTGGGHYSFKDCTFAGSDGIYLASTAQTDGLVFEACNFEQTVTTCAFIEGIVNALSFVSCRTEGNNGAQEFLINPAAGKYVHGLSVTGCSFLSDNSASDPIYLGGDVKGFNISGNVCWVGGSNQFVNLVSAGDGGVVSGNYSASSPKAVSAARAGVMVFGNQNSSGALAEYWGAASWQVIQSSYTATATGMTTSPTGTVKYSINGKVVTLDFPAITGTSNATTFTLTGGPAEIRPTADKDVIVRVSDNGGVQVPGLCRIKTTGVIELYANLSGNAFTASGTKFINTTSVSYTLA